MSYLEWNDAIVKHLFLQEQEETLLCLSMKELVEIGRTMKRLKDKTDEQIERDCRLLLTAGLPNSGPSLTEKVAHALHVWTAGGQTIVQSGQLRIRLHYPPFVGLLLTTVLPIVEDEGGEELHGGKYYARLNKNKFWDWTASKSKEVDYSKFRDIEPTWIALREWSSEEGRSRLVLPQNPGHRYVGMPLSQCPLRPKHLKRLTDLFERAKLFPRSSYDPPYSDDELLTAFSAHARLGLGLTPARINELSAENGIYRSTLLSMLRNALENWDGSETKDPDATGIQAQERLFRGVLVPQIQESIGSISWSYRLRTRQDTPEDLAIVFNGESIPIIRYREEWSKKVQLPYLGERDLTCNDPRWKLRTERLSNGTALFIRGSHYGLGNEYWIATPCLERHFTELKVLCTADKENALMQWHDRGAQLQKLDDDGIPGGHVLYRVTAIWASHPDATFTNLQLPLVSDKELKFIGGIPLRGRDSIRCYIPHYLPTVHVINGEAADRVELVHDGDEANPIALAPVDDHPTRRALPADIRTGVRFKVRLLDPNGQEVHRTLYHEIRSLSGCSQDLPEDLENTLPKRGPDGRRVEAGQESSYVQGCVASLQHGLLQRHHEPYSSLFYPRDLGERPNRIEEPNYDPNSPANTLLTYLTGQKQGIFEDTFRVAYRSLFDRFYSKTNEGSSPEPVPAVSRNYYEYLGHLELTENDNGVSRFQVNAPRLIPAGTQVGRRVLLTGGRDPELIRSLFKAAIARGIQPIVSPQLPGNDHLLLPDAILLEARGEDAEQRLRTCAAEAKIPLELDQQKPPLQVALSLLSSDLQGYSNGLEPASGEELLSGRSVYDTLDLKWVINSEPQFPKTNVLAQYSWKNHDTTYWWWKVATSRYVVDRNWGIYLTLHTAQRKDIILKRRTGIDAYDVLVPVSAPLPRLLNRALSLISGLAPETDWINGRGYRKYSQLPSIFADNLFRKLGQVPLEIPALPT